MSGQRQYSMGLRERVIRMALETRTDPAKRKGAIEHVDGRLGNLAALCAQVRAVEQGGHDEHSGVSSQEAHIQGLEAEDRELRRTDEILKAA